MIFTRMLRPVGQGAFFTEYFKEEGYSSSIIYDCGSMNKELLNHELDRFKKEVAIHEYAPFNLLFISHFDNDHINGLSKLIDMFFVNMDYIKKESENYEGFLKRSDIEMFIKVYITEKYHIENIPVEKDLDDVILKEYPVRKSILLHFFRTVLDDYVNASKDYNLDDFKVRCKAINSSSHRDHVAVIIPFLYPNLIKILLPEMDLDNEAKDALNSLFKSEIKIIGLDDNESPKDPFNGDFPGIKKEDLFKDNVKTIDSFTRIIISEHASKKECWYYMPFNPILDPKRKEKFLSELFIALKFSEGRIHDWFVNNGGDQIDDTEIRKMVSESKRHQRAMNNDNHEENALCAIENFLKDGVSDLLTDPATIKEFEALLKKLYKNASSGIKQVTAINVNSLNVLSWSSPQLKNSQMIAPPIIYKKQEFELRKKVLDKSIYTWYQHYMTHINAIIHYNEQMKFLYDFSCLYTGDCVMEKDFFRWIDFIHERVLKSSIGLVQIPHHGRNNNYDKQVVSRPIFSSFINFNEEHKQSENVQQIEFDFSQGQKPCFEITEKEESRFIQSAKLNTQSKQ